MKAPVSAKRWLMVVVTAGSMWAAPAMVQAADKPAAPAPAASSSCPITDLGDGILAVVGGATKLSIDIAVGTVQFVVNGLTAVCDAVAGKPAAPAPAK